MRISDWIEHVFSSYLIFFYKQKTAYEMRISDWSSDVCSSDLARADRRADLRSSRRCGQSRRRWRGRAGDVADDDQRARSDLFQLRRVGGAVPQGEARRTGG